MYYIGVDLGGTNIKIGVVDDQGQMIAEGERPTLLPRSPEAVCDDIAEEIHLTLKRAGIVRAMIRGLGVGCPGTINPVTGYVEYSNNLGWREFPMRQYLFQKIGISAAMGNDANVAALGEVCAGSAKGASSAVIITLGTGVGSGVVLDGSILTGYNFAAAEIGHMVIAHGGRLCTCGRKGCFEAYASATALIHTTKTAIEKNPQSGLAAIAQFQREVNGQTAFLAAKEGDPIGRAVVDEYITDLACGITNIINIFQPEVVSLGGGISKEGDALLLPLREKVYKEIFGGKGENFTQILCCTLGYKAGVIGAAMLAAQSL